MRGLLYLVHRIPYPPNKGDKIRSYHLLKFLAARYRVFLGTFVDDADDWRYVDDVKKLCAEVYTARLDPRAGRLRSLRGFATGDALTLPYYFNADLRNWADQVVARNGIDRIVAFSSPMAQYARPEWNARRVMDFVDVDSDKWAQYAKSKSWPMSWIYRRESNALLRYEREIAQRWDASIFVSHEEAGLFKQLAPDFAGRVHGVYNGADYVYFAPGHAYENPYSPGGPVLVFTGAMDYWANVDAVTWFARDVFPLVKRETPNARFYIVGSRPTEQVTALGQIAGVTVTGAVPDVRPYLAHAAGAVATLRIARGIQNKVLEALSMAKPVVATSAAAEGLIPCDNAALRVADAPNDVARECVAILRGEVAPNAGASGRDCVIRHYDWDRNLSAFAELLEGKG